MEKRSEKITASPVGEVGRKKSLLFVCLGNICRSPAAEGVFRAVAERHGRAGDFEIDSAGTYGGHAGDLPDERMRRAALRRGYSLTHRSRQLRSDDLVRFDHILCMDESNAATLRRLARSETERAKIELLVGYCRHHTGQATIPDPYYGGEAGFALVLDLIEDSCEGLFEALTK